MARTNLSIPISSYSHLATMRPCLCSRKRMYWPAWRQAHRREKLLEVDDAVAVGVAETEDAGSEAGGVEGVGEGALVQRVELLRVQTLHRLFPFTHLTLTLLRSMPHWNVIVPILRLQVTGWHIRLLQTSRWHHNKSSILAWPGQAMPKWNCCFDVNGRFHHNLMCHPVQWIKSEGEIT